MFLFQVLQAVLCSGFVEMEGGEHIEGNGLVGPDCEAAFEGVDGFGAGFRILREEVGFEVERVGFAHGGMGGFVVLGGPGDFTPFPGGAGLFHGDAGAGCGREDRQAGNQSGGGGKEDQSAGRVWVHRKGGDAGGVAK